MLSNLVRAKSIFRIRKKHVPRAYGHQEVGAARISRHRAKKQRDKEARSQEPEGIGASIALAGCFELDAEILATGSWLFASNANKIPVTRRITV